MKSQEFGAPAPTQSSRPSALDLSKSRRTKGVSLEEIAEKTKISLRFLLAIEAEEFEKLPGGIFNTSYLRQYAAAIGLDEGDLLACYNRAMNPSSVQSPSAPAKNGGRGLFDRFLRLSTQA
jgi:cytoskeletal protein RodZ